MNEMIKTLGEFIDLQVRVGYDDREAIIKRTFGELFMNSDDEAILQEIIRLTDLALENHYEEQRKWNYVTDCDLLDEAFAELDRGGIIARQHFTCCQTCGHAEIECEIDNTMEHRLVRGYVFFHQQDSERAALSKDLYLAYGAVDGKEESSVYIGFEVVSTLLRNGVYAEWDGTIERRIRLPHFIWQRRRVPALFTR